VDHKSLTAMAVTTAYTGVTTTCSRHYIHNLNFHNRFRQGEYNGGSSNTTIAHPLLCRSYRCYSDHTDLNLL